MGMGIFCAHCHTTTTPLWRRLPDGSTVCNACGLYYKSRNAIRPVPLPTLNNLQSMSSPPTHDASKSIGTCPGDGHCDGTGGKLGCYGCPAYNQRLAHAQPSTTAITTTTCPSTSQPPPTQQQQQQQQQQDISCANCGTTTTPLWRRDTSNRPICNACGLYFKLHGVARPVGLKTNVIKRRKRQRKEQVESVEKPLTHVDICYRDSQVVSEPMAKRFHTSGVAHVGKVPPIEDYIVPKRAMHQGLATLATVATALHAMPQGTWSFIQQERVDRDAASTSSTQVDDTSSTATLDQVANTTTKSLLI